MDEKRTMTLTLTEAEMSALEEFARRKELSETALIRQALRLYQLIEARSTRREQPILEDHRLDKRPELMRSRRSL